MWVYEMLGLGNLFPILASLCLEEQTGAVNCGIISCEFELKVQQCVVCNKNVLSWSTCCFTEALKNGK